MQQCYGSIIRRQQHLIRCLSTKMQSFSMASLEVDAVSVLKSIAPSLDPNKHKGQAAVLTPNVNEYKRLVQKVLNCDVNDQDGPQQLLSLANSIGGVTILRKGHSDYISDGKEVKSVSIYGSPRRCGGQGDILSGSVAVFLAWARQLASKGEHNINPAMLGCIAGSALMRKAASVAFEDKKRSTLTTDIIECLGRSLEDICPVH